MQKGLENVWMVFAFQGAGGASPGDPVTGDAANITADFSVDGSVPAAIADTTPEELGGGYYYFVISASETDGETVFLLPESATANVQVVAITGSRDTRPQDVQQGLIAVGTAQAATATSLQLAASETFEDDVIIGATLIVTGGTNGAGQSRLISDYDSTTDTATVDTWTVTPTGTITYALIATPPASVSSPVPSNVVEVGGDQTSADGIRDTYNGVGYSSDVAPSTQAQVGSISTGTGSGLNYPVIADNTAGPIIDGVTFVGTQVGTFADTEANIATFHQINSVGNAIDLVYRIAADPGNTFTSITLDNFLNGSNDTLSVQLYDHIGLGWDTVDQIVGKNGAGVDEKTIIAFPKHTGAFNTPEAGNIYVRFVTSGQTDPVLFNARCIGTAAASASRVGYADASVWVSASSTNNGTRPFIDGTADNPVETLASARAIALAVGLKKIQFSAYTAYTVDEDYSLFEFSGVTHIMTLSGAFSPPVRSEDVFVSGSSTATTLATFIRAGFSAPFNYAGQILVGTATIQSTAVITVGDSLSVFRDTVCEEGCSIDFVNSTGNNYLMDRMSGKLIFSGLTAGDSITIEGGLDLTLDATCTGGTVTTYGSVNVIDNSAGVTVITRQGDTVDEINAAVATVMGKTDQLTFTKANELDANTRSINSAEVVGNGNTIPWDAA